MERYFIVTEKSTLHKDWFDYKENATVINDFVKQFMKEQGIEANEYYVDDKEIYIVPTEADVEKFKPMLCAPLENELRKFKVSSKIGKAWTESLKAENLKVLRKPMVILYFKTSGGRFSTRLFDQDGTLYCSINNAQGDAPKGMVEMKASEFFKVIEERESA